MTPVRVVVLSGNLGGYDPEVAWVPQVVPDGYTVEVHRFTDATFPPRSKAMTPSLQCGILKMFGWQIVPGADLYIWIDASRGLLRDDTVAWFLDHLRGVELLLFKHPERHTIREEYEFVKRKLAQRSRYLTKRYAGEWLDEQYKAVTPLWYRDDVLYASTAFAYRSTVRIQQMLTHWWVHKSRYLLHDQLALPFVVRQSECSVKVLDESVYTCPHLPITRVSR